MNPLTSAKAWSGGLTAAIAAEYAKPTIEWAIALGSRALERCCDAPLPEAAQTGLVMLTIGTAVAIVTHWIPNKSNA